MSIEAESSLQDGMNDPVAFQRYEYKYIIPSDLMEPIRSFIRPYCDMDPYAERERDKFYTIRTLYLDSAAYRTYWDKVEEVPDRFKLRIRTYGRNSHGPVKFEVKRRFNDIFVKSSVVVPEVAWPGLLAGRANGSQPAMTAIEKSTFDGFIWLTGRLNAGPKMLVQYDRQAFRSRIDRYVRLSFDRRICHHPQNTLDLLGRTEAWVFNDDSDSLGEKGARAILELKFISAAPVWLSDMVRTFGLVRRGFSKYCSAVTRTLHREQAAQEYALAVPLLGMTRRR